MENYTNFKNGTTVEVIECPPPGYGYDCYFVDKCTWVGSDGRTATVVSHQKGNPVRLINLSASTFVEIRSVVEE